MRDANKIHPDSNDLADVGRKHRSFRMWTKTALLTGIVMGALWLWVLKVPIGPESLMNGIYLALLIPAILVSVPVLFIQHNIHDFWGGWIVFGAILNWLLYSELVYKVTCWRRRKRESSSSASLPSPESSDTKTF